VGASAVLSASAADQDELLPSALLGLPPSPEQQLELRDRYLDWASLLKRVHGEDVLVCPNCGHRPLRIIAAIDDPSVVTYCASFDHVVSSWSNRFA
jgi:aminoglycoside phosphotransferase